MKPPIRYARTSDGVRIAYTCVGSVRPVLHCEFPLQFDATLARNSLFNEALMSAASVTYFDHGGCGASDRDVLDMSVEAFVRATEAVVAASMGNERFTVIAVDEGRRALTRRHREVDQEAHTRPLAG